MNILPTRHSFRLTGFGSGSPEPVRDSGVPTQTTGQETDTHRRNFLKALGVVGLGVVGASVLPSRTEALVMGSAPSTGVVGVRDSSNTRVNPAIKEGAGILKKTVALTGSGAIHTPTSGKSVRIYNTRFSLSADMTNVSFRFTAGGTDYETYLSPKAGGLYGANNQPNYVQGGVDQAFYCSITGTGTVQINVDYLEV
jgi:hypothetical protein